MAQFKQGNYDIDLDSTWVDQEYGDTKHMYKGSPKLRISVGGISCLGPRINQINRVKGNEKNGVFSAKPTNGGITFTINADNLDEFKAIADGPLKELIQKMYDEDAKKIEHNPRYKNILSGKTFDEFVSEYRQEHGGKYPEKVFSGFTPIDGNEFLWRLDYWMEKIPTTADLENAQNNITNNFKTMLSQLNDAEQRKALSIQVYVYDDKGEIYGTQISKYNKLQVYFQRPTATFVTNSETWRSKYNRKIKTGAQPIIITRPLNSKTTGDERENKSQSVYGMTRAEKRDSLGNNSVNNQEMEHGLSKMVTLDKKLHQFYKEKVYDVSDTEVIQGMEDKFAEVMYKNQMTGEKDETLNGSPENGSLKVGLSDEDLNAYFERLVKRCNKRGVQPIIVHNDVRESIIRTVYAFVNETCSQLNVVKDKDTYAKSICMMVAAMFGIESQVVSDYIKDLNGRELAIEDAQRMWPYVEELLGKLNESKINSFNDFVKMLKNVGVKLISKKEQQEKEKEIVTESFFKYLNRMDESKHNLKY